MRNDYLPTDEPIKQVLICVGEEDERDVIYVYPQDSNGNLIKYDGLSFYHIIRVDELISLQ
jgi:hypothetical protein